MKMECIAKQAASRRLIQALARPHKTIPYGTIIPINSNSNINSNINIKHQRLYSPSNRIRSHQVRYSSSSQAPPPKHTILEQPDKFRPPSHAARRNVRSTTSMYGAGAAYNQERTEKEKLMSQEKTYPHMFPDEGTRMHWFLTTKWVHVLISLAILLTLAFTSMFNTWSKTSPFAHLIPSLNTLPFHPFTYLSELWSVYRLHLEYTTQQVAEHRRQNILDAQKRRLYRRSHGLEDLEADEVSGPDVRGLVEWDDGLTNKERERGGQHKSEMIGASMQDMGQRPGEDFGELMERKRREQADFAVRKQEEKDRKVEDEMKAEEERLVRIGAKKPDQERPRRKLWFGIW